MFFRAPYRRFNQPEAGKNNGTIFLYGLKSVTLLHLIHTVMAEETATLIVTSSAFEHEGSIPVKYTCDGEGVNPPLHIDAVPELAKTLVIIADDPDAPGGVFDHWLVWEIDPTNHTIPEDTIPGISGTNSAGKTGYHSPCPPDGQHRYFFHVFALREHLGLSAGSGRQALQDAMKPHIIATGNIMGVYQRNA